MYLKMIKRRFFSVAAALVFLFMAAGCRDFGKENDYMSIDAHKAKEMMEKTVEYVLLDVRSEEEFSEGHIPGAALIPHEEISERAEEELPDKSVPVFVYCRSGRRSKLAAEELIKLGYSSVYEFGGITDWPYEIEK